MNPEQTQVLQEEPTKKGSGSLFKFILLSVIGIVVFFIPFKAFGGVVPMVGTVNFIKGLFGDKYLPILALVICGATVLTMFLGKVVKIEPFKSHHADDGPIKGIFYLAGVIMIIMNLMNVGPAFLLDPKVGGEAIYLAATIFLTITISGWLVCFILESGIVEFFSVLIEPVMRPVFQMPGEAAVDAVSAFVSSAAVGVYLTDQHYQGKRYTKKEAYGVVTSFCVMSVGYLAVLTEMAGISNYYTQVAASALLVVFIIAPIMMRIFPLRRQKEEYVDGTIQTAEIKKVHKRKNRFKDAVQAGIDQSSLFNVKSFFGSLKNAFSFAHKIVAFLVPVVVIVMGLTHYTPLLKYLGKPIVPLLRLLRLPNPEVIASACLIGIVDVSLPTVSIMGQGIATQSAFFVVVLSAIQIISFTESANAMMEASFEVKIWELILIFLMRTLIAMPIIALISHILF